MQSEKKGKVKQGKVDDKSKIILQNLYQNREGLRVKTLIKLTQLKQRTVYKKLNNLKDKNLIENVFPIWKLVNGQVKYVQTLLHNDNIFELHNVSYVLKLIKTPDWWKKRKNRLTRLKEWQFKQVDFGKNNSNPYQQIKNENFIIQTYPESIIIISRKRYYSNSPFQIISEAINDVVDIIDYFEERFKFKFFPNGFPSLEIRSNDFNRMKDYIAERCKKDGHRFLVELDKNRKVWVDYSEPFGKEANYPNGQEKLEKITKDYLMKELLLPSEIQGLVIETSKQIKNVTNNQVMFDKNFQSHLEVIKKLGKAVDELTKEISKLKK